MLHSICQQTWKTHKTGKGQISFQSERRAMAKNAQTTMQLCSLHMLAKEMLKILQARLQQTWGKSFQMYKLALERAEEPEIKLPTSVIPEKKKIYFCFIDCAKAFDCVDHKELWEILKEMQIPDHITCLLINLYAVKKQQSELDLHQGCILSPCLFSFYMQRPSCKIPDRMKPKLESRLP